MGSKVTFADANASWLDAVTVTSFTLPKTVIGPAVAFEAMPLLLSSLHAAEVTDFEARLEQIRRHNHLPALAAAAVLNGEITDIAATGFRKAGGKSCYWVRGLPVHSGPPREPFASEANNPTTVEQRAA